MLLTADEREAIKVRRQIKVPKHLRSRWRKDLPVEWFRKYGGELFTVRDLYRAAVSQTKYGFAEWYLAVHLRRRQGFGSVLKCTVRNDPGKKQLLDRLLGSQAKWLRKRGHHAAPPDLLVYSRQRRKPLFFAEAKLDGDPLRSNQRKHFVRIYRKLGLPTRLYHLVTG